MIGYIGLFIIEPATLALIAFVLLWSIGLCISRNILTKKGKSLKLWVWMCPLPLVACAVHLAFHIFLGAISYTVIYYGTIYFSGLLILLLIPFRKKKRGFRIAAVIINVLVALLCLFSLLAQLSFFPAMHNMTQKSYSDAFDAVVEALDQEYVLSQWKSLDLDAISQDVRPYVENAEQSGDETDYYIAMMRLAHEISDGHVTVGRLEENDETYGEAKRRLAGNDYGFILYTLYTGQTAAFDVEPGSQAEKAGIHSGTIITEWDGVPMEEALENTDIVYPDYQLQNFPVAENETVLRAMFLAGKGNEEITVTFLDDAGVEQQAVLQSTGSYDTRLDRALSRLFCTDTIDYAENYQCRMLTDHCGYLQINAESVDYLTDLKTSYTGECPEVKELITQKLNSLRQEGMETLVLDLRGNRGGVSAISAAVASLFVKEGEIGETMGGIKGMESVRSPRYTAAEGTFSDIRVVALVNHVCISSGDILASYLSQAENVTLMGITNSNCSGQSVGGLCLLPDGTYFSYPISYSLEKDGTIFVDTTAQGETRIPLDVQIPVTQQAASAIFEAGEDYELSYAAEYLQAGANRP